MCVDIRVYTCIKISIYIQIFLPGIGQMYMCSFLVTQWLSDRWKRFSLQQIVVSMVPWWALTYPEKGILAINGGGKDQPINFVNFFYKQVNLAESRKKTGHLKRTEDKKELVLNFAS